MKNLSLMGAGAAALALSFVAAGARPAQDDLSGVEGARELLDQWVETRKVLSKEKRDWRMGKEVLQDRISLVSDQIEALRMKIDESKQEIEKTEGATAKLVEETERLDAATAGLAAKVLEFEERTKALVQRLPAPIAERVDPLLQRFPKIEEGKEVEASLSSRFLNFVGVLNQVNKAHREILVVPDFREVGDGEKIAVTALYMGIGQAFYASSNGEAAGVGSANSDGWFWRPANESAEAITKLIAVHEGSQAAEFVPVPVRVD